MNRKYMFFLICVANVLFVDAFEQEKNVQLFKELKTITYDVSQIAGVSPYRRALEYSMGCSICLESKNFIEYYNDALFMCSSVQHYMCKKCVPRYIYSTINASKNCPMCRAAPTALYESIRRAMEFSVTGCGEGADFSHMDLSSMIDFLARRGMRGRSINLSKANLSGCNLSEIDLVEVDLSGANLSETTIEGVVLENVKLVGANFTNAYVKDVRFIASAMAGACFKGACIIDSQFIDIAGTVDFTGALFEGNTGVLR